MLCSVLGWGSLIVKHHQCLGTHGGVALDDTNVAAEGRSLVLVTQLEIRSVDLHRLGAILRKALHRVRHALHGTLGMDGLVHQQRRGCKRSDQRK